MNEIGSRIKSKRGSGKQSEIARNLGVVKSTVCKWEKGQKIPSIKYLVQLEELLELGVLTKEFIKAYRKENK